MATGGFLKLFLGISLCIISTVAAAQSSLVIISGKEINTPYGSEKSKMTDFLKAISDNFSNEFERAFSANNWLVFKAIHDSKNKTIHEVLVEQFYTGKKDALIQIGVENKSFGDSTELSVNVSFSRLIINTKEGTLSVGPSIEKRYILMEKGSEAYSTKPLEFYSQDFLNYIKKQDNSEF